LLYADGKDRRQTVTFRFPLYAASVINTQQDALVTNEEFSFLISAANGYTDDLLFLLFFQLFT